MVCCCLCAAAAFGQEVIPPAPTDYFSDSAHVVSPTTAGDLNVKLRAFEQTTGNQVLVAIYPKMQSDSAVADYAVRVFRAWQVGQKERNNGAVFFIFIQDHQMFIEVGYGLEGALPDGLCEQILDNEVKPRFKAGDYNGGVIAGVNAILAATQHEYKGTGATVDQGKMRHSNNLNSLGITIFVVAVLLIRVFSRRRGWMYSSGGWGGFYGGGGFGGGGGGGGGGGFSGGGGSTGGGGAGSSW